MEQKLVGISLQRRVAYKTSRLPRHSLVIFPRCPLWLPKVLVFFIIAPGSGASFPAEEPAEAAHGLLAFAGQLG